MNNEPVAWINREEGSGSILDWEKDHYSKVNIPLYTHPVKEPMMVLDGNRVYQTVKEQLTDEEIASTWDDVRKDATLKPSMKDMQDFARAILRKAQEK